MTDERYDFFETVKTRKSTANSARNRVGTGKSNQRGCKLPSDHLKKEEIEAMASPVISIMPGKEISKEDFRWLSKASKRDYLRGLAEAGNSMEEIAVKVGMEIPDIQRLLDGYRIALAKPEESKGTDMRMLSYGEYIDLSADERKAWLNYIYRTFRIRDSDLAAAWGFARSYICRIRSKFGIPALKKGEKTDMDGWKRFAALSDECAEAAEETEEYLREDAGRIREADETEEEEICKTHPFPEELWAEFSEYCDNDAIVTKEIFDARQADWKARLNEAGDGSEADEEADEDYSSLLRLQITLSVHSWDELYHCLKGLPFPESPIEVRTVARMTRQASPYVNYADAGADR